MRDKVENWYKKSAVLLFLCMELLGLLGNRRFFFSPWMIGGYFLLLYVGYRLGMERGTETGISKRREKWEELQQKTILEAARAYGKMGQVLRDEEVIGMEEQIDWRGRYLECRESAAIQFLEMERVLQEMSLQIEKSSVATLRYEEEIRYALRQKRIKLHRLLIMEKEKGRLELYVTLQTLNGKCVTVKEVTGVIGKTLGKDLVPEEGGRTIVGKELCELHLLEKTNYYILSGIAKITKEEEEISGDTFSCRTLPDGRMLLCLADGMGSGKIAFRESGMVIEYVENLLESGFSPERAITIVNSLLLLKGEKEHPTTLDLGIIDLYTGEADFYKQGAVNTFIERNGQVIQAEAPALPLGVCPLVEPEKVHFLLEEGDRIVMMTDGALEAIGEDRKEEAVCQLLSEIKEKHVGKLAEDILTQCLGTKEEIKDDMTVLVGGIWKNQLSFSRKLSIVKKQGSPA